MDTRHMRLKLKYHDSPLNQYTQIDKYIFVPKKFSENFPEGEITVNLLGESIKTRVYDIFCDCRPEKHTHKVIDLREIHICNKLKNNQEVEILI